MTTTTEKFEQYCILELFGHNKIAGLVTEQSLGGTNFIRVDVPMTSSQPGFTRLTPRERYLCDKSGN
jgi:hypothetical protein